MPLDKGHEMQPNGIRLRYFKYDGSMLRPFDRDDNALEVRRSFMRSTVSPKYRYKKVKYVDVIGGKMKDSEFMQRWLRDKSIRYEMMYKTIKFLVRSKINPEKLYRRKDYPNVPSEFTDADKTSIRKEWRSIPGNRVMFKSGLKMTKDVVGIWTLDFDYKHNFPGKALFGAVNVEHVVSNAYGADNMDKSNGVLLDEEVNKAKSDTMLFLVDDSIIKMIGEKITMQKMYMKAIHKEHGPVSQPNAFNDFYVLESWIMKYMPRTKYIIMTHIGSMIAESVLIKHDGKVYELCPVSVKTGRPMKVTDAMVESATRDVHIDDKLPVPIEEKVRLNVQEVDEAYAIDSVTDKQRGYVSVDYVSVKLSPNTDEKRDYKGFLGDDDWFEESERRASSRVVDNDECVVFDNTGNSTAGTDHYERERPVSYMNNTYTWSRILVCNPYHILIDDEHIGRDVSFNVVLKESGIITIDPPISGIRFAYEDAEGYSDHPNRDVYVVTESHCLVLDCEDYGSWIDGSDEDVLMYTVKVVYDVGGLIRNSCAFPTWMYYRVDKDVGGVDVYNVGDILRYLTVNMQHHLSLGNPICVVPYTLDARDDECIGRDVSFDILLTRLDVITIDPPVSGIRLIYGDVEGCTIHPDRDVHIITENRCITTDHTGRKSWIDRFDEDITLCTVKVLYDFRYTIRTSLVSPTWIYYKHDRSTDSVVTYDVGIILEYLTVDMQEYAFVGNPICVIPYEVGTEEKEEYGRAMTIESLTRSAATLCGTISQDKPVTVRSFVDPVEAAVYFASESLKHVYRYRYVIAPIQSLADVWYPKSTESRSFKARFSVCSCLRILLSRGVTMGGSLEVLSVRGPSCDWIHDKSCAQVESTDPHRLSIRLLELCRCVSGYAIMNTKRDDVLSISKSIIDSDWKRKMGTQSILRQTYRIHHTFTSHLDLRNDYALGNQTRDSRWQGRISDMQHSELHMPPDFEWTISTLSKDISFDIVLKKGEGMNVRYSNSHVRASCDLPDRYRDVPDRKVHIVTMHPALHSVTNKDSITYKVCVLYDFADALKARMRTPLGSWMYYDTSNEDGVTEYDLGFILGDTILDHGKAVYKGNPVCVISLTGDGDDLGCQPLTVRSFSTSMKSSVHLAKEYLTDLDYEHVTVYDKACKELKSLVSENVLEATMYLPMYRMDNMITLSKRDIKAIADTILDSTWERKMDKAYIALGYIALYIRKVIDDCSRDMDLIPESMHKYRWILDRMKGTGLDCHGVLDLTGDPDSDYLSLLGDLVSDYEGVCHEGMSDTMKVDEYAYLMVGYLIAYIKRVLDCFMLPVKCLDDNTFCDVMNYIKNPCNPYLLSILDALPVYDSRHIIFILDKIYEHVSDGH
ncbi:hypothetical protein HDU85_005915 [Gaertneriomyces sp. JEL0708]|nr:hypothetical protein HDU85_005915 [Gaertneriomyces sp. JEL0708]